MAEQIAVKVDDIFDSMNKRFIPEGAAGIKTMIGYRISGKSGGSWILTINDGKMNIDKLDKALKECAAEIITDDETFVGINTGKVNPADMMKNSKLSIKGDMAIINNLLPKVFMPFNESTGGVSRIEELIDLRSVSTIKQRFATGPVMGTWLKGLEDKKFYANRCSKCGRTQTPPREICAVCRLRCTEYVEVGPSATVTMIDRVLYASPDPLTGKVRKTPYATLFMVLDGSTPDDSFSHELKREDIDRIKKGMKVRPVWAEKRTGSYKDLLYFEIDE